MAEPPDVALPSLPALHAFQPASVSAMSLAWSCTHCTCQRWPLWPMSLRLQTCMALHGVHATHWAAAPLAMLQRMSPACRECLHGMDLYCAGKLVEAALEPCLSSHGAATADACNPHNLMLMFLNLGMKSKVRGMADEVHLVPALLATVGHVVCMRAWPIVVQHGECIASSTQQHFMWQEEDIPCKGQHEKALGTASRVCRCQDRLPGHFQAQGLVLQGPDPTPATALWIVGWFADCAGASSPSIVCRYMKGGLPALPADAG